MAVLGQTLALAVGACALRAPALPPTTEPGLSGCSHQAWTSGYQNCGCSVMWGLGKVLGSLLSGADLVQQRWPLRIVQ